MILTIEKPDRATVTIDTKPCVYPWAIRDAIELALKIDDYEESSIDEIFGRYPDAKVEFIEPDETPNT